MFFLKKITSALKSPYPQSESKWDDLQGNAIAALIVGLILFVLRPFGLSHYQGSIFLISLGFATVTFVVGILYNFSSQLFGYYIKREQSFTLGMWLRGVLWLIICIALGNLVFASIIFGAPISLEAFALQLVSTIIIGVFPLAFFGFQNQLRLERLNTKRALNILESVGQYDEKEDVQEVLLLVQSMENYIHVYKKTKESLIKETYRRTLISAQNDEVYDGLIKCHRSFLFNPDEVIDITGNAQGLKLSMSHPDSPVVPVSRSFIESAREAIQSSVH